MSLEIKPKDDSSNYSAQEADQFLKLAQVMELNNIRRILHHAGCGGFVIGGISWLLFGGDALIPGTIFGAALGAAVTSSVTLTKEFKEGRLSPVVEKSLDKIY